jgi:hypothetical protein
MGDAEFISDSRAAAGPRWVDQRLWPMSDRGRTWAVAEVVLWGIAAVLAVVAPFLQLFVVAVPTARVESFDGVDGWGHFGAGLGPRGHGPLFGIALSACALGLAWLAVQRGRALRRADPGLDPVTAGMAVGVPCLLAGVTVSMILLVQSYADQFAAIPVGGGGHVRVQWGWGLWLSLASLVLAVAATCMLVWPSRSATGDDEPDLDAVGTAGPV